MKALVSGSIDKSAFANTDFVIEAVFENLDVKKKVFAEVEEFVSAETILATNTSSLSITKMAADLKHPERVVGFHFFNPVAVLPLLEVVKGEKTDDATLATAFATAKTLEEVGRCRPISPDSSSTVSSPARPTRSSVPSTRAPCSTSPTAQWANSACR